MNPALLENNFLVLDDFIAPERASMLYQRFQQDGIEHPDWFIADHQCPKSLSVYNYRWFVELLVEQIPLMSQVVGELVLPTYTYARLYRHGELLKKHRDRPACEISVTLHLGSDGSGWPIYLTRPDGSVAEVELKAGQGVVYLGCQSRHWRNEFAGQHYGQVFLHYVKSRGDNWGQVFDRTQGINPPNTPIVHTVPTVPTT